MDRTTRLIRWQRITIAVLLAAIVALGLSAVNAVTEARQGRSARKVLKEFARIHRDDKQMAHEQAMELQKAQQTIRDLTRSQDRLLKYEDRYGKVDFVPRSSAQK